MIIFKLKSKIRSFTKQKLNTSVIIISLAIGLACVNLIGLFIHRELTTDGFHQYKDQIFILECDSPIKKGERANYARFGSAEYMKDNFEQVEDFCRIINKKPEKIIANQIAYFDDLKVIAVSSDFFDFFSYKLLTNNPRTALETMNSLVISEELAKKYFGSVSPIGQIINLTSRNTNEDMIVSGVFRKSIKNSQLTFDMVRKGGEDNGIAFVRLSKNIEKIEFEKVLEKNKESIPIYHTDKPGAYSLVQLQDNYLGESSAAYIFSKRGRFDLWLAILISLFILVIALINYLGLVNNQLKSKVKEYAIRRINGSSKRFLVVGFMIENSILVGVAFVFSLFLAIWIAPFFNDLVNTNITPSFIFQFESMTILLGGLFIILFVTLIFVGFHIPFRASLSPLLFNKKARQFNLPLFSIIQLGISMVLIISSYVMLRQIQFIANKDIGIDETVVDIKLPAPYQSKTAIFKEELAKIPAIENVSVANGSPFSGRWIVPHVFDINGEKVEYSISIFSGDEHFVETLGIKLIAGSTFQGNHFNYKNKYLINQSFADLFPTQELIGEPIPGKANSLVIGIVEDFHYSNLKQVVTPAYIEYGNSGSHLLIKASENQMNLLLKEVAVVWEKLIPDFPLEATTIKQQFAFKHRENDNYVTIFSSCCLISIFLSMIGLFTISVQNSQNRTKEIGIRKVNGAKVFEIIQLLNKEFVIWIGVAFIIACPFAYYGMTKWLQNFAYKTTLEWWVFVLSGCIALGIALLTVSWQTFTAARRNPVEALHYE